MSKLEVLELLYEIFHRAETKIGTKQDYETLVDYESVMFSITSKIEIEKRKPEYFDYTLQEHQEALYG